MTTPATQPAPGTPAPPAAGGAPPPAGGAPPPAASTKPATFLDDAGGKPAGETKPGEKAPETKPGDAPKFEVKFPETLKLDEAKTKAFTELATKLKLDSATAQPLVDFYAELATGASKAADEAAQAELKSWNEQIVADKDLGGTNLEVTKKNAAAALKKFATPGLRQLLTETGLGSHPEIVRFVAAVGKADADDTVSGGSGGEGGNGAQTEESFLQGLFPTMFKKG